MISRLRWTLFFAALAACSQTAPQSLASILAGSETLPVKPIPSRAR